MVITRMPQTTTTPSTSIPSYALYGDEADQPAWLGMVHFEQIHERSSLFRFDIAPHVHEGLVQLLYVTSGGGEAVIDATRWSIYPQTLIVIPASHVHGFRFSADIDGPVVTAAQRPLESLAALAAPDLLPCIRQPLVLDVSAPLRPVEALMPLFDAIALETRLHHSGEPAAGTALLLALFVQIRRITALQTRPGDQAAPVRSRKAEQVEQFRALVDRDFRRRRALEDYAAELGISAGQLSRLCREMLGLSGLDVINARIVHEAERELVYSTLGIKQIAAILG
ncbi:MAG: hypothetical protein RJA44_1095, partial [Pseudomonadota bacterium]